MINFIAFTVMDVLIHWLSIYITMLKLILTFKSYKTLKLFKLIFKVLGIEVKNVVKIIEFFREMLKSKLLLLVLYITQFSGGTIYVIDMQIAHI